MECCKNPNPILQHSITPFPTTPFFPTPSLQLLLDALTAKQQATFASLQFFSLPRWEIAFGG